MKEMGLLHAEGSETWEMAASGPQSWLQRSYSLLAALFTGQETDQATGDGARHAEHGRSRFLRVGQTAAASE